MTKTPKEGAAGLSRVAIHPEDAHLLALVATLTKDTQAEAFRKRLRRHLRTFLTGRGVDLDRALTEARQ